MTLLDGETPPNLTLGDIGEKRLIAEFIRPLFNPSRRPESIGDDCALLSPHSQHWTCISTDRVPADLISFRLGLIDHFHLGRYLVVLNLSDIAACGGTPTALLLNLAFPSTYPFHDVRALLRGIEASSSELGVPVVGGDLSHCIEMSISATAIGLVDRAQAMFRSTATAGELVFCSDPAGVTCAAFQHYLSPREGRAPLSAEDETLLTSNFRAPRPRVALGRALARAGCRCAMDVTDGLGQSLLEIAEASDVCLVLDADRIPAPPLVRRLAEHGGRDWLDVTLGPGADFQLVGTIPSAALASLAHPVHIIGEVRRGRGLVVCRGGEERPYVPEGWNYFMLSPPSGQSS